MNFPVYRRYNGIDTFFRIDSPDSFLELKIMGSMYQLNHFFANNFLDRVFISDMISLDQDRWLDLSAQDFDEQLEFCKSTKVLFP